MAEEMAGGVPWRALAVAALMMSSLAFGYAGTNPAGGGESPSFAGGRERASGPSEEPTATYILWTDPSDRAVGVPLGQSIFVKFAEPVNTTITFSIAPDLAMTDTWDGTFTLMTLAHAIPFDACTTYTATMYGVSQGSTPNPWSFATSCPNPYIVATVPLDGATTVPVTTSVNVTFSAPMNTTSVVFTFAPAIAFTPRWNSPTDTTVTLSHASMFSGCTLYTVEVAAGQDKSGLPLVPGRVANPWTFRTVCPGPVILSTDPYHHEDRVASTRSIQVVFSDPMNRSTVTWTFSDAGIPLTPTWDPANTTLTLTPTTPFALCTVYTASVDGTSTTGFPLQPPSGSVFNPWTFMTFCTNPFLVNAIPPNGWLEVPLWARIGLQFSEQMNRSSLRWAIGPQVDLAPRWSEGFPGDSTYVYLEHAAGFSNCTTYTVQVWANDTGGNTLVPSFYANPWRFTTVCPTGGRPVTLISPAGGEDWTGGSAHQIIWAQESPSGADLAWTLEWLNNTAWELIAKGTAGNGTQTYMWRVPRVDSTDARVRVCAGPPPGYQDCSTSGPFTIDSATPALVSHDPQDSALDVPVTMFLTGVFSEAMDRVRTERALIITPPALVVSIAWPDPTTIVLRLEGLRSATRYTWGFGCSATDVSDPGNPLADCQETHDFTTEGGIRPTSISLVSPTAGESWTGGPTHAVRFSVDNAGPSTDVFAVTAAYRYAAGALGGSIGTTSLTVPAGVALEGQVSWSVPIIDAPDVVVNVTATNRTGATFWDDGGGFEIDSTPPQVLSFAPSGPQTPVDPTVVVVFSEPMGIPVMNPLVIVPEPGAPPVSQTLAWDPSRVSFESRLSGTVPCTRYNVSLGASLIPEMALLDDSIPGNFLAPVFWTFTTICGPAVGLLAPDGGEDWTGGSVHAVRWVATDPDDSSLTIDLSYSLDSGADGFSNAIANGLVVGIGAGSYSWTLPFVDSEDVLVRIAVVDPAANGAMDTSAAVFTIDSTPPALLVSFPADGASGHKTTRDLWFVWTERVDRASFAAAFTLSPDPGGLRFEWSVSNLGGDVLFVAHDPMRSRTGYTATFAGTAKDDSDPGNFLAGPAVVRFTTQPPPPVNPPVALAVGHDQVEVGVPATFDGRGSTGDIRQYVWRIEDNQDRFVAVLVGALTTYTFQQQGRYTVTLFVTDVNGYVDDDSIDIAVTSNPHSDVLIAAGAAGAALAAAALIGGTEAGKLGAFQLFLFPLYARRKRDELLDHENRGMIRGYILVHPGDSYSDIRRNLGLSNGTLSYHLTVLEREGIVRSQVRGSRKLFFPREARLPNDGGGMHEVQTRMIRAIQQIPGLAVTDLAGALGITSQLALYHLRDLAAKGRIRFERRGLRLRCYAEPWDAPPETPAPKD